MTPRSPLAPPLFLATAAGLVVGLAVSSSTRPELAIGGLVDLVAVAAIAFAGSVLLRRTRRTRRRLDDAGRRALRTVRWRLRCSDPVVRSYARRTIAVLAVATAVGLVGRSFPSNVRRSFGASTHCTLGRREAEWRMAHRIRDAWAHHRTLETSATESPEKPGGAH